MDFDLDDPLENDDSFFDDHKTKRASLTKTPEKKTLDSLLAFDTQPKSAGVTEETKKVETVAKKPMDDWLLDTTKDASRQDKSKSTDFLDDILPIKPKPKPDKRGTTSLEDILKESKAATAVPKTTTSLKDVSSLNPDASIFSTDVGKPAIPAERRRGGRRGSGVEDSLGLGLFSSGDYHGDFLNRDKKEPVKPVETFQKTSTPGVPDWLGIGSAGTKRSESPISRKTEKASILIPKEDPPVPSKEPTTLQKEQPPSSSVSESKPAVVPATSTLVPQDINAGIQNTYSALHQQESLLLVSLQFKKYEEVLKEIQDKQTEILGHQEKQFKNFVDEYILKQQMVENNIRLQQERINNQIQMLVSDHVGKSIDIKPTSDEPAEKEDSSQEVLIRKIKQRHDEELFLMEESYKKQMDLIERGSVSVEENLRNELKNITSFFEEKFNTFKVNNEEQITYYKEKMETMEEQHRNEMKVVKDVYTQKLDDIKAEHVMQIDYIKEMKQKETSLLDEGHVLTQKLDTGINLLGHNVKVLQGIEEKVIHNYDVLALAREQSIQTKEKEILLMKKTLEKCRESAENERAHLLSLVRNLELKLAEQSTNAQEDRWALQQASATLMARSKALEREAEYSRNLIEREREQLKTLKESFLTEQERLLMQVTEEKLQLASEKAKFETSTKLVNSYEVERAKTEAETAISEAKNLTERLNQERNLLQRQKFEMTALKQNLTERERELEDKEAELEFLMQDSQKKLKEDKQVLMEAKRMETTYKEKLKELQTQWALLCSREKKLAEEKILLSRERLALYTSLKASKDCVLCSTGEETSFGKNPGIISFENVKIPDLSSVKIRLEALDDEESEVSKEGSIHNK
ncbi:fas-binding factor 1-like [Diabrotica virgifera virgifera]|uniref:Fas-binding factor 1-like n=1 Tax=Diabrotica virgifera virgifera TaxID=50390 RepID=A0A6P7FIV8_DIAVI|nr:fas-binding factor 1-like [Diabrotica virgifera virgifera]